jgi:hypothetical protein
MRDQKRELRVIRGGAEADSGGGPPTRNLLLSCALFVCAQVIIREVELKNKGNITEKKTTSTDKKKSAMPRKKKGGGGGLPEAAAAAATAIAATDTAEKKRRIFCW